MLSIPKVIEMIVFAWNERFLIRALRNVRLIILLKV